MNLSRVAYTLLTVIFAGLIVMSAWLVFPSLLGRVMGLIGGVLFLTYTLGWWGRKR